MIHQLLHDAFFVALALGTLVNFTLLLLTLAIRKQRRKADEHHVRHHIEDVS